MTTTDRFRAALLIAIDPAPMTTTDRFRAALLIAIDPTDLEHSFRRLYRTGCARCGGPRDAPGPKGGLRACCCACLELLKLYRVYGAEEAQRVRAVTNDALMAHDGPEGKTGR